MYLKNKFAIVTGASAGIGRTISIVLGKKVSTHLANAVREKNEYVFSGALGITVGNVLPDETRLAFSNRVVS